MMKQAWRSRDFKLSDGKQGAALTIRVTPRASKNEISGVMDDGTLRVRVTAPPVEGKANEALIEFLSDVLGVRKNQFEIVAGERGRNKIISVLGMPAPKAELAIKEWMKNN